MIKTTELVDSTMELYCIFVLLLRLSILIQLYRMKKTGAVQSLMPVLWNEKRAIFKSLFT